MQHTINCKFNRILIIGHLFDDSSLYGILAFSQNLRFYVIDCELFKIGYV